MWFLEMGHKNRKWDVKVAIYLEENPVPNNLKEYMPNLIYFHI